MVLALIWAGFLSSPNPNSERTAPRDPLARWILIAWTKLTSPRNSFNRLVLKSLFECSIFGFIFLQILDYKARGRESKLSR